MHTLCAFPSLNRSSETTNSSLKLGGGTEAPAVWCYNHCPPHTPEMISADVGEQENKCHYMLGFCIDAEISHKASEVGGYWVMFSMLKSFQQPRSPSCITSSQAPNYLPPRPSITTSKQALCPHITTSITAHWKNDILKRMILIMKETHTNLFTEAVCLFFQLISYSLCNCRISPEEVCTIQSLKKRKKITS